MRSYVLFFLVASTGGVLVWAGCGSDETVAATASEDGGAGSSSSSSSGSSGPSGSSTSSTSSGGPSDAGQSSSGALGGDGGIDPPDAGPGGDTTKIACGATSCALATDTCCVSELAAGGNNAYACTTTDAGCPPPAGGGDVVALKCSAQANCPANTVCCVRQTNNGATSECKPACGQNEAQLCDPKALDGGGCTAGNPCSNDNISDWGNLPASFATCGGKGN